MDFNELNVNLEASGITEGKKLTIYSILSAILNLGNIKFEISESSDEGCFVSEETRKFLNNAATLLNIDEGTLEDALISKTFQVAGSQIRYIRASYYEYFQQVKINFNFEVVYNIFVTSIVLFFVDLHLLSTLQKKPEIAWSKDFSAKFSEN